MAKSLVIYFSRTGENYFGGSIRPINKGNTERVAETIQKLTGADLFRVEPVREYPDDYTACTDVAAQEKQGKERPAVKAYPENLEQYDTVFIGYPIWWGTFPMPMFTLLEKINLSGKRILPFSTHEGSGLGSSVSDLKRLLPDSKVESGLAVLGSQSAQCESQVKSWLQREKII